MTAPARAMPAPSPYRPALLAGPMSASVADQTWATRAIGGAPCFRVFLLLRGEAVFTPSKGLPVDLAGRQMLLAPFSAGGSFRLHAGGGGAWTLVSEDMVWRVVADSAPPGLTRNSLDQLLMAPLERIEPGGAKELAVLFEALARETTAPGPGATAMCSHYLALVLAHLWRASGLAETTNALGAAPTAQRFRRLIETRYREHLSVDAYCGMLGVTRAHLHNACLRALGRSPQRLVHDRLAAEARLRLGQNAQSIEQIAFSLGFRDPAYFNRFFRRLTGMTPGAYRTLSRIEPPKEQKAFAAWP